MDERSAAGAVNEAARSPLHRALRAATSTAHRRLDRHPLLAPLVAPTLTLQQYVRALQALLYVHEPLQAALRSELAHYAIDYPLLDRVAPLRADLARLKVSSVGTASAPISLPPTSSVATLIGRLYVVEGSRLGGRSIARCLQQRLGLTAANGAAFFNEGGEVRIDRDWPAFWRLAEGHAADVEAVIAGALATFTLVADALDACERASADRAAPSR